DLGRVYRKRPGHCGPASGREGTGGRRRFDWSGFHSDAGRTIARNGRRIRAGIRHLSEMGCTGTSRISGAGDLDWALVLATGRHARVPGADGEFLQECRHHGWAPIHHGHLAGSTEDETVTGRLAPDPIPPFVLLGM